MRFDLISAGFSTFAHTIVYRRCYPSQEFFLEDSLHYINEMRNKLNSEINTNAFFMRGSTPSRNNVA